MRSESRASGVGRPLLARLACLAVALVLAAEPATDVARAADPQFIQYVESPYHWVRRPAWLNPRATGLLSDAVGWLGMLGRVPFEKYERTSFMLDLRGTHPLSLTASPIYVAQEDVIDIVQQRREIMAGNVWARLTDYHMLDFGALYWLTGNFYDQKVFLSYVQASYFDDLNHDDQHTVDFDLDGRSFTELAHRFTSTEDPTRSGLRLRMRTQYRDGDEFQLLLVDEKPFRWLLTTEVFWYREILREGQKERDLLDPEPYPLESPPRLTFEARIQEHLARSGYDARSKGLQAVIMATWSPDFLESHPTPNLFMFPQLDEELRCGIIGGDLDGICTLETSPGYKVVAIRLRNPLSPLGFNQYFEGVEGDMEFRLRTDTTFDANDATFKLHVQPEVELALRFY